MGAAIVGAQKCGTTSLAAALADHPDVCLAADKEAHLFDDPLVQRHGLAPGQLDEAFPDRRNGQLLLDATPSYLYLPGSVEALVRHNPHARVVVVLRPAAERALSHYHHERRRGQERRSVAAALALEPVRLRSDRDPLAPGSAHRTASYMARGRYVEQLRQLASRVPHLHHVLLSELVREPERVLGGVLEFLGLDPFPVRTLPHLNRGGGGSRWVLPLLRARARREMAATEQLLGWAAGSLSDPELRAEGTLP